MISLVGGIIASLLGLIFLIAWRCSFWEVLKGTLPILFILGGALAAYLGYEEIKDKTTSGSTDDENVELKNEVESLKEELKELKGEKTKSSEGDSEWLADQPELIRFDQPIELKLHQSGDLHDCISPD